MLIRSRGGNPHGRAQRRPADGARQRFASLLRALLLAGWMLTAALVWAAAPSERVSVTTLRPLLLTALAHGYAHGTLVGEAVPFMAQHLGSSAPIEIDVRTLHALPQPGCQRLEVTTTQRAVIDPKTARPQHAKLIYQISYCRNGEFPEARTP
jgi:hypothetical protein